MAILHKDEHYDALTSLPGLLGCSYFCPHCLKGYDHLGEHTCLNNKANHCGACLQEGCTDHGEAYKRYRSADLQCHKCRRFFYGQQCLDPHHLKAMSSNPVGPDRPLVCTTHRKCPECLKLVRGRKEIQQHRCSHVKCRCCKEILDIHEHKCYLQREKTPEELRQERREHRRQSSLALRGAAAGLQTVRANEPSTSAATADDDLDVDERIPPLHVFFDIESMQVEGRHVPNLVVAETKTDDFVEYYGEDCIHYFWNGSTP